MDSFDIVPETLYDTRFGESEDVYALDADDTLYSGPGVGSHVSADVIFAPPSGPGRASAARRPTVSARAMAQSILNPTSKRREQLPDAIQHLYPHVFRSYTDDHDAYAVIDWSKCSAANIWAIITSPHLCVGNTKAMTFMLTFVIKGQLLTALKHVLGQPRVDALKAHVTGEVSSRGIKVSPDLERLFIDACSVQGVLGSVQGALTTYNITQNHVIRFKSGVFPEVSNVQQWTARVAAIMVEPCLQEDFHSMVNANPSRLAVHEPSLRITNHRQRILERITNDYVNNPSFIPQSNPSIASWCNDDYDSSIVGKEPRSWVWVSSKIQEIKKTMTDLMKNFNKSGEGESDADMHVRDLDFFENYAKRDALWFWIYLCWDHGIDIPVWNLASLPEDESLDLGAGDSPTRNTEPSSRKKIKRGREDDDALTNSVAGLVDVSKRALDVILANQQHNQQHSGTIAAVAHHHYPPSSQAPSSQSNSTVDTAILSPARKRASELSALKDQLQELVAMREMLPEQLQGPLTTCISKVTDQVHGLICLSPSDLTA
jgi:hypothetical protein